MFVLEQPLAVPQQATVTIRLKHEALVGHNIGRFRLSTTSVEPSLVELGSGNIPKILAIVNTTEKKRNKQQREELEMFLRTVSDYPLLGVEKDVLTAKKAADEFDDNLPTCMVMKEQDKPRETFLLVRGQYDNRGEVVTAGLPAALPPLPSGETMNRLGLARWLVSREHPLTARVWVNRQWERLFGTGLVKSSENFGMQSEFPSHPELLDWLAVEFRDGGWDMKATLKKIVISATYRQASQVTPALLERDPENRLLARGPRFRLPAELIRDQALVLGGLLTAKIGGPSVRPYMPEGVWDETSVYGDMLRYQRDSGESLYRRTMYTIWKRTAAPPTMLMFDSPSREFCTVKRSRTNTPLQALALLNEVTYVEAARALGEEMLSQAISPSDRLARAFREATSRMPTSEELRILTAGLERRLAKYQADPESAKKLLAVGDKKQSPQFDPIELAAYTLTANVILNLDETVTKE